MLIYVIFALLKNLGKLSNDKTKSNLLYFSGTIEDTELVDGLILDQKTIDFGAPTRIEKAKIGLIQFVFLHQKLMYRIDFFLLKKILFLKII